MNKNINFAITKNGIPILFYYKKDSKTCNANIIFKVGSSHEDQDSRGVAHFLEHMNFQGTSSKDKHQINREMSSVGAFNAYTGLYQTCFYFNTINDNFDKSFDILSELVFDSVYPENDFEKEKSVIIEEWRTYDNIPSQFYYEQLEKHFFNNYSIIGDQDSILNMSIEKLLRFKNKWYGSNNIIIVIAGNLNFKHIINIINNNLSKYDIGIKNSANNFIEFNNKDSIFVSEKYKQTIFGLMKPWYSFDEVFNSGYIKSFLKSALNVLFYEKIRDDLGLCYSFNSNNINHLNKSYISWYALTNSCNVNKMRDEVNAIFNDVKKNGFSQEIIDVIKFKFLYRHMNTFDNINGYTSLFNELLSYTDDIAYILEKYNYIIDDKFSKKLVDDLTNDKLVEIANLGLNDFNEFTMICN